MRRANIVSGIVLAVFGLVMVFAVIPAQIEPGPEGIVSPRLVPNMAMILIIALSMLLVVNNLRAGEPRPAEGPSVPITRSEFAALLKLGTVFGVALTLYLYVSPLAAGAGLVIGTLVALGERRPIVIVLMPAVLLAAIWLLFYKVLGTAIV
jgi:putative tricarboxylic transport membrane protein